MSKYFLTLFFTIGTVLVQAKEVKVVSPDKKTVITFATKLKNDNGLTYSVSHQGSVVIAASPLGLEFENENSLSADLAIAAVNQKSVNLSWKPVYGERNLYPIIIQKQSFNLKKIRRHFVPFQSPAECITKGWHSGIISILINK
jgi:alpha-glucosidase